MAPIFLGTHEVKLDSKGRVSIPAPFRPTLSRQGFDGVILFPSYKVEGAIEGCGQDFLNQLMDSVNSYELFSDAQEDLSATIFGAAHQLQWDSNGRIVLPEALITAADIKDKAVFVGTGALFRIWQPERWAAYQAARRQSAKEKVPSLAVKSQASGQSAGGAA
ncbi:division/cell wall cluster transcriptional repressor MraZ [Algihabitans sp.]|uniref:division/cell wall cluster transcriptional repressor MraZ n=1 Tax=Algihabitans sp. TaxID=2821514 RepID=UPI003BAB521C